MNERGKANCTGKSLAHKMTNTLSRVTFSPGHITCNALVEQGNISPSVDGPHTSVPSPQPPKLMSPSAMVCVPLWNGQQKKITRFQSDLDLVQRAEVSTLSVPHPPSPTDWVVSNS